MPLRVCLEPGCPALSSYRGRCTTHASQRSKETRSQNKPLYNSKRWKLTRQRKLNEMPLCESPPEDHDPPGDRIATDVHHKQAVQHGGTPWAMDNLEALCHPCHSRKTRREQTHEGWTG
jgi:5-methylcytosine-specific restriction protein A